MELKIEGSKQIIGGASNKQLKGKMLGGSHNIECDRLSAIVEGLILIASKVLDMKYIPQPMLEAYKDISSAIHYASCDDIAYTS